MGLAFRSQAKTLVTVAVTGALALGCQNGRSSRTKGAQAQTAPVVTVTQPPSAFLTVSPNIPYAVGSYLEASVGDAIQFRWNGENSDLLHSYFTIDALDACGGGSTGPIGWVANTLTGTTTMTTLACQAGRTYTYYYETTDSSSGKVSQAIAMVHVLAPMGAAAQGSLKVTQIDALNNDITPRRGYLEVNPGDSIKVYWDGQGATSTLGETTVDSPDTCGANTLSFPEIQSGTASPVTRKFGACAAGHVYTTNFKVTRGGTTAVESRMIVRVRSNPTLAAPTASVTANGTSGAVEVTAGQTLTFDWSSTNADQGDSVATMTSDVGAILCADDATRSDTQATSWDALGPSGNIPTFAIPDCKGRHIYTITFTAYQTQTGKSATATLTLKVNPRPGT